MAEHGRRHHGTHTFLLASGELLVIPEGTPYRTVHRPPIVEGCQGWVEADVLEQFAKDMRLAIANVEQGADGVRGALGG